MCKKNVLYNMTLAVNSTTAESGDYYSVVQGISDSSVDVMRLFKSRKRRRRSNGNRHYDRPVIYDISTNHKAYFSYIHVIFF